MAKNDLPAHPRLFCDEDLLLALMSPYGPRAALQSSRGVLKVAAGRHLAIERSELTFLDAAGRPVAVFTEAFGLARGTRQTGPVCRDLRDGRTRPPEAVSMTWSLNDRVLTTEVQEPPDVWGNLRAFFLPLQVPVHDDFHIVTGYVNTGSTLTSSVDAVRQAICWVDGCSYRSVTGGTWNGPSRVQPGGSFGFRFALDDFPGAPRRDVHELSIEMFGLRTPPMTVRWSGEFSN